MATANKAHQKMGRHVVRTTERSSSLVYFYPAARHAIPRQVVKKKTKKQNTTNEEEEEECWKWKQRRTGRRREMTQSLANRLPPDRWKKKTSKRRKSKKIEERQTKKKTRDRWTLNTNESCCFFLFVFFYFPRLYKGGWTINNGVVTFVLGDGAYGQRSQKVSFYFLYFLFFLFKLFRRKETIRDWWDMSALDTGSAADSFQLTSVAETWCYTHTNPVRRFLSTPIVLAIAASGNMPGVLNMNK